MNLDLCYIDAHILFPCTFFVPFGPFFNLIPRQEQEEQEEKKTKKKSSFKTFEGSLRSKR